MTILLAYDGSDASADAVVAAARLLPGADAVVVFARSESAAYEHAALARIALPDSVIAGSVAMYEREEHEAARLVADRGLEIAEAAGLAAIAEVESGPTPCRAICRAAVEHGADLVVCGSRGHGGFTRAFLGSTSSCLLYHCPRPVLVLPHAADDLSGPLVIGYDGSEGARAAIIAAAGLLPGRVALVVHVESLHAGHASEQAEEGAALAREHGLDAQGVAVESDAGAWRGLSATARAEGASVVVAGCRGRGAIASTVLGSVASGLVHNAELPTLIVRDD